MRVKRVQSLNPGEKLGKALVDDEGKILLHRGVELTHGLIKRLMEKSFTYVYVEDPLTSDIEVKQPLRDETRLQAVQTMKEEFHWIGKEENLAGSFRGRNLSRTFSNIVDMVLTDVKSHDEAIGLLSDVLLYDSYVFTHSLQVTVYTLRLAVELGFSDKALRDIGLGAILHDVGKMNVPENVLNKPGKLTDEEFDMIKQHTLDGYYLLKDLPNVPILAAHCALQHHERIDGSGYPHGRFGKDIHDYAKVMAVADVFDAVTSHRVYRKAMLPHEGLEILYQGAGTLFDHDIVAAFQKVIALFPNGVCVNVSNGSKAVVVKQNRNLPWRPVIRIVEQDGTPLSEPYDIDLSVRMDITITNNEDDEEKIDVSLF
ncbi:HD-GYP domain-containing protein [Salibacterium halotolerans]|uniref:HDIG domain-containing protein n=1 Tax=Salibacterium halotolerans TaxID=1884432 RepID=A0A1I5QWR1_9BACI|nr:HD-GYP domain-containing protein [Salibacterium halotolerans]SFP50693.1 HDIG domain-containing protein [Salibacterium halotolerans]